MRIDVPLRSTLLLTLLVAISAGCESLKLRRRPEAPVFVLTTAEKIRLTKESAPAFENAAGGACPEEDLQRYVQNVGDRVAAAIPEHHPREFPFAFRVLNTKTVNAFSLPGGYVYVTRGLLEHIRNEDELAGILACQTAHVTMAHFDDKFHEILLVNLGVGVPVAAVSAAREYESPVYLCDQTAIAMNLRNLRFTPEDEAEANATAVQYIARTGRYHPQAVIDVLEVLDALRHTPDTALPAWHYTHPAPPERKKELRELLERDYPEFPGAKQRFIKADPVIEKMRKAGETYLRLFEKAESERKLGERMSKCGFPENARVRLESALKYYDGATALARESEIEVASFYAGRALAYRGLLGCTRDESFRKKARADFDDAKRIDPRNFVARLFRGYYFLKVDRFYRRARDELLEAARLNPGAEYRGLPYLYLAELYDTPDYKGRDEKTAAQNYEMYLVLNPLGDDVPRVTERLKELKPDSEILELLK